MAEEQQEVTQTPAENKARKNGWLPEDNWHGDAGDWVDYKEFNLRGELMGRINEQSSIINHLTNKVTDRDTALSDMADLQSKISEREYKKALASLLTQKKEALEEDDYSKVVDIDEEISEIKAAKPVPQEEEVVAQSDTVPQEIVDWLSKPEQSWYHTDTTLRIMAEGFAVGLQQENPNIPPTELCKQVNEKIRKEMPHRFNTSGDVDTGGEFNSNPNRRGSNGGKPTFSDLNEEQQAACKRFERLGTLTRDKYIQSLVDIGEI